MSKQSWVEEGGLGRSEETALLTLILFFGELAAPSRFSQFTVREYNHLFLDDLKIPLFYNSATLSYKFCHL